MADAQTTPRKSKTTFANVDQVPADRVLNSAFWLTFGDDPEPSARSKMLFVTIDDVARVGPMSFNAVKLCEALDVSQALLNFHFGSRDELMAEALLFVYDRMVRDARSAVEKAKPEPEARLRAWIESVIHSYDVMGGWGVLVHYAVANQNIAQTVKQRYGQQMIDLAELNLAILHVLVQDLKKNRATVIDFELGKVPQWVWVKNPKATAVSVSVALSVSGLAVWRAGKDPEQGAKEGKALESAVTKVHIDRIIESL